MHDLVNGSDVGVMNIKKLGPAYAPPLTLSYNPAEKAILVNEVSSSRSPFPSPNEEAWNSSFRAFDSLQTSDGGIFDFFRLPQEGTVGDSVTDAKRGQGSSMLFVARNRFAVFSRPTQVSNLSSSVLSLSSFFDETFADRPRLSSTLFRPSTFEISRSASPSR